jgi:hypothetical protein
MMCIHLCVCGFRPSFAEILDRLDEILINISIKNEKGKELWRSMKNKVLDHSFAFSFLRCRKIVWLTVLSVLYLAIFVGIVGRALSVFRGVVVLYGTAV